MRKIDTITRRLLIPAVFLLLCQLMLSECKKKEEPPPEEPVQPIPTPSPLPVVSTLSISAVTEFSAFGGGNVSSEGNSAVSMVGICWDTNPAPTTLRSRTYVGAGTGTFSSVMDSLKPSTKYYVRAYATNFSGTAYGNEVSFKTGGIWEDMTPFNQATGGCILVSDGTVFFGRSSGIIRSTDNGLTWTSVYVGLSNNNVKCLLMNGSTLYAGTPGGIFISNNMGDSWSSTNSGLSSFNILSFAQKGTNVYAGTSNGVFVSTNNGSSWSKLNGLALTSVGDIVVLDGKLYAGAANFSSDIYVSSDDGANWTSFSNFFAGSTILYDIKASGTNLFAAAINGFYIYKSGSWAKLLDQGVSSVEAKNNMVLASYPSLQLVYISHDNGSTFNKLAKTPNYFGVEDMEVSDDYIFAAGGGKILRLALK